MPVTARFGSCWRWEGASRSKEQGLPRGEEMGGDILLIVVPPRRGTCHSKERTCACREGRSSLGWTQWGRGTQVGGTELPQNERSWGGVGGSCLALCLLACCQPLPSALCPLSHVRTLECRLSHLISPCADFPSTPSHPPFSFSAVPISLFPHLVSPLHKD